MKENSNRMAPTDRVFKLIKVLIECIRVGRFDYAHATLIKGFNGLVNWTPLLLIISVTKSAPSSIKLSHLQRNSN